MDPQPLAGGITNQNFTIEDRGRRYVVRVGDDILVHGVVRANELAASRAAHAASTRHRRAVEAVRLMLARLPRSVPPTVATKAGPAHRLEDPDTAQRWRPGIGRAVRRGGCCACPKIPR